MKIFEYKVEKIGWAVLLDEFYFNEKGKDGWELAGLMGGERSSDFVFIFKREKNETVNQK